MEKGKRGYLLGSTYQKVIGHLLEEKNARVKVKKGQLLEVQMGHFSQLKRDTHQRWKRGLIK